MSNSKGWLKLGHIWHLNKRIISVLRSDKIKERDFELLGVADCVMVNIRGELVKDKCCFSEVCYVD